jgi:hypothetical protein
MLSKLIATVMVVFFLTATCMPAYGHDGKIPNIVNNPSDEDPWGGEHHFTGDPGIRASILPNPKYLGGPSFFIALFFYHFWMDFEAPLVKSDDNISRGGLITKGTGNVTSQPEINNTISGTRNW